MNATVEIGVEPHPARWWHLREDDRIECRLCPRGCKLRDGQWGFCRSRRRIGSGLTLPTYGRTSGFSIDPIEKKPLHHFLPGTAVLSFGTVGCNLGCRFCQNWDIARLPAPGRMRESATPEQVAASAVRLGCRSVAFTYNDPVIFAEYAIEVARACHAAGIRTVAVTAGYITAEPRSELFGAMDAVNVDLKAFGDEFYRRLCLGRLGPVLDTLRYLHRHTAVWLEVTTLLIPGFNDSVEELDRAAEWFASELGPDVPWHFTAYHPDFKLAAPPTPLRKLERAREIARAKGIRHVYLGNTPESVGASTWCPHCGRLLIQREGGEIRRYHLDGNRCVSCKAELPGRFDVMAPRLWPRFGTVRIS